MPSSSRAAIASTRSFSCSMSVQGIAKDSERMPGADPGRAALHDVLQRREAAEQADPLQRARDAHLGQLVRLHVLLAVAVVRDDSLVLLDEAADDVEDGRLARAVGADEPGHEAVRHPDRHSVEDLQAAQLDLDPVQLEEIQRRAVGHGTPSDDGWRTDPHSVSAVTPRCNRIRRKDDGPAPPVPGRRGSVRSTPRPPQGGSSPGWGRPGRRGPWSTTWSPSAGSGPWQPTASGGGSRRGLRRSSPRAPAR